ncbi:hypothetical protein AQUCO_00600115v1 [Aquilegia coerulea]|uniref:ATP-dependent DNA helicase n=1 Tax=Aquilegia coerulea TaxID=218851 RepID=A0A2G5EN83_AQUCA|nr:hypothetical protein AQUCO_00600115v1 [Aquilegia coerulea]
MLSRYIGPVEAAWHLLEFPMHKESPHVERLPLHLKGMHMVVFNPNDTPEQIEARALHQHSKLTAYFNYYTAHPTAVKFTYLEFPQHFVWIRELHNNRWEPHQQGFAIGRMYFAKPNEGERFYLRLLLTIVQGCPSFEALKQVDGICYPTYKDACIALGLLEDDQEYSICLAEASIIQTGYQLRRLFAILLTECSPLHPASLWDQYVLQICDDVPYKLSTCYDYGLFLLDKLLLESGKSLLDYPPMPLPVRNWSMELGNRLILEQMQLRYTLTPAETAARVSCLNQEQHHVYDVVTDSVSNNKGKLFFVNGAAGIASLLLFGGRTAHSTFKLPLDVMENSLCGFTKQSIHAELFRQTSLIIWDEVPAQHRYCIEAVDRSLQDVRGSKIPCGGISVGSREEVVRASIGKSPLWKDVEVLHLLINLRLHMSDSENTNFATFLAKLYIKLSNCFSQVGTTAADEMELPAPINHRKNLQSLLASVYPALNVSGIATSSFLRDRAILAPRNDDVKEINQTSLEMFLGQHIEYLAADVAIEQENEQPHLVPSYPTDTLNSLDPSSLPPFRLMLKIGAPIMLLRNIAPKDGLCNGVRLIVKRCANRVIEAIILTGDKAGNTIFIPRITLTPSVAELAIPMSRRQFPLRLAFGMTINKSQGQSVKYLGIDLQTSVFSHGQLYVALSRCTTARQIFVVLSSDVSTCTANIVYPEVLL